MLTQQQIQKLNAFRDKNCSVKMFNSSDAEFITRIQRRFKDNWIFQLSMRDGKDDVFYDSDQIIFGQVSVLLRLFRIIGLYPKGEDIGADRDDKEVQLPYQELKSIKCKTDDEKLFLVFKKTDGEELYSVGVPSDFPINDLAILLNEVVTSVRKIT